MRETVNTAPLHRFSDFPLLLSCLRVFSVNKRRFWCFGKFFLIVLVCWTLNIVIVMGAKCQVCGNTDYSNPELSFHRFPSEPEKCKIWFALVGFSEDRQLPKKPLICSNHFEPRHIITRENGKRFLDQSALPLIHSSIFPDYSSSSSGSNDAWGLHENLRVENKNGDDAKKIGKHVNIEPMMPIEDPHIVQGQSGLQSVEHFLEELPSTSTDTATEGEQSNMLIESRPRTSEAKRKLFDSEIKKLPKRKRRYIGDMSTSDFSTPEKRSRNWKLVKDTVVEQKKKIHNLQMTVRRQRLKIASLKGFLNLLNKKGMISESSESAIKASLPGATEQLFERMLKGPSTQKYSPELRTFALTLAFYSPKAYNFVRNSFNKSLPHLDTISKWFRSVDGSPGFTSEALRALTMKQEKSSSRLLCNLVMDEMAIRKQVEWNGTKLTGLVDIGTNLDDDNLPEAREALVFMVVCLNGSWKVPVGYFLIDGLRATEKAGLVRKCLEFLHGSLITVTSLTFDGAPSNITMAEELGADFSDINNLQTSFKHPVTQEEVFLYPDACHMLKLVRNCLASQDDTAKTQLKLEDSNGRSIKWDFIEKLAGKQNEEGLHAATKLRLRHISWEREKMKVRLAAQTLSRSVSDAITFLREDLKDPIFADSEGTSLFLLNFNNLFDILNSRNRFVKYQFKRPMSPATADGILNFLKEMKEYIIGLILDGRPILRSRRKTGFLGFLICIKSLEYMYSKYVVEEERMKYLLTYKLSQDHLEVFFGTIRSRGGHNNNPTAKQFEAAYKRLLVHTQIRRQSPEMGIDLEYITILTCGSQTVPLTDDGENPEDTEEYRAFEKNVEKAIEEKFISSKAWDLTLYTEDIVAYISGFVLKILKKTVTCVSCLCILEDQKSPSLLLERKRYGRLTLGGPLVVIDTCKAAEKLFRFFHATQNIFNKNVKNLSELLINQI